MRYDDVIRRPWPDQDIHKPLVTLGGRHIVTPARQFNMAHCRFGVGRTGTFVTSYLLRKGLGLKLASRKLKKTRANPTNCFRAADRLTPPGPTGVSYPSGRPRIIS